MKKILIFLLLAVTISAQAQYAFEAPGAYWNKSNTPGEYWKYNPATLLPWANTATVISSVTLANRHVGQLFIVGTSPRVVYTFASSADVSSGTLTPDVGFTLGAGVATWLATPSWTNFNAAITGTAPFVKTTGTSTLSGSPTFVTTGSDFYIGSGSSSIGLLANQNVTINTPGFSLTAGSSSLQFGNFGFAIITSGNDFSINTGAGLLKLTIPPRLDSVGFLMGIRTSDGAAVKVKKTAITGVTSVTGTSNRITSTGGTTPQLDISASYVGQSSITTTGALSSGSLASGFTPVTGAIGGTGVANTGKTITLGGNLVMNGAFATTFTSTGTTNVTLPTTGTLATLAGTESLTNKTINGVSLATGGTSTLYLSQDGTYTVPVGSGWQITGTTNMTGDALITGATEIRLEQIVFTGYNTNFSIGTHSNPEYGSSIGVLLNSTQPGVSNSLFVDSYGILLRSGGGLGNIVIDASQGGSGHLILRGGSDIWSQGWHKFTASTTFKASLNIPHGTAPSSTPPVDGDFWTTTAGLFAKINGTTNMFLTNIGKQTFAASTTGAASINIPSGTWATSPVTGDLGFDGTHLYFKTSGSLYDLLAGVTGVTNSAANTELMMSNGTNAVPSSLFINGTGSLITAQGTVSVPTGTDLILNAGAGYGTGTTNGGSISIVTGRKHSSGQDGTLSMNAGNGTIYLSSTQLVAGTGSVIIANGNDIALNNPYLQIFPTNMGISKGAGVVGANFTIRGAGGTSGSGVSGDNVSIIGGDASSITGNGNGGNVIITPGTAHGSGTPGVVQFSSLAGHGAGYVAVDNSGNISWGAGGGGGGGGITNSAANGELMMSDGTNAVSSGLFATSTTLTFVKQVAALHSITISAPDGISGTSPTTDGDFISIKGGSGYSGGNGFGGSVSILAGVKSGSGTSDGNISINSHTNYTTMEFGNLYFSNTLNPSTISTGGGKGVLYFGFSVTNPTSTISNGGVMFVKSSDGLPYWRYGTTDYSMTGGGGGGGVSSIATTGPITGGTITSTGTIGINDAAADGTTKGAATFTAADFNATSGLISIDYTNGTAATTSVKGFLTSTDWNTFNGKQDALVSGSNIKTVNGVSLMGAGDLGNIDGGHGGTGVSNTGKTITLGGSFTTTGAFTMSLTATATTAITLPTTGTLSTLAGTESLTNKTINGITISGSATPNLTVTGTTSVSGANTGDQTLNSLLPTQTGNAGKFLTTDATNSSWAALPTASSSVAGIARLYNTSTGTNTDGSMDQNTIKTYVLGAKTFTGKQTLAASATGAASLNIPSGTAPTSPADGDIWYSSSNFHFRVNGLTGDFFVNLSGGALANGVTGTTQATGDNSTKIATTAYVAQEATKKSDVSPTINTQVASYTLVLADAGKVIEMNSSSANNLTIPPHSSVALPVNVVIPVLIYNTGTTTVVAGAGVTLDAPSGTLVSSGRYSSIYLQQRATDEWYVIGTASNLSFSTPTVTKTTTYTATINDGIILCDATSGAFTVNLPAVATYPNLELTIVKIDNTNNVTIDGNASETINGATTLVLSTQYGVARLKNNGTAWYKVN